MYGPTWPYGPWSCGLVALVNKLSVNDQAQALVCVTSLALCRDYWHPVRRHSVSSSSLPPRDGGDPPSLSARLQELSDLREHPVWACVS